MLDPTAPSQERCVFPFMPQRSGEVQVFYHLAQQPTGWAHKLEVETTVQGPPYTEGI